MRTMNNFHRYYRQATQSLSLLDYRGHVQVKVPKLDAKLLKKLAGDKKGKEFKDV
jgi:hypothetical protein